MSYSWVCRDPLAFEHQTHFARYHPTVPPHTLDLTKWVVVSKDDAKTKERAKKIPVVIKGKITLKVVEAVDGEATSYSEASLGRSDGEWKLEEDASYTKPRSATDSYLSSGSESAASSKDANTSPSSSSASSSSSSSGVEVLPKKKALKAKGTKRPTTTAMLNAKKRCALGHEN